MGRLGAGMKVLRGLGKGWKKGGKGSNTIKGKARPILGTADELKKADQQTNRTFLGGALAAGGVAGVGIAGSALNREVRQVMEEQGVSKEQATVIVINRRNKKDDEDD